MMHANILVVAAFVAVVTMVAEAANSGAHDEMMAYKAVHNCVTGTAKIYREATLTSAMEDAIAGVISLQDPLQCTARYCRE